MAGSGTQTTTAPESAGRAKYPEKYMQRMAGQLGDEADAFVSACQETPCQGIRLNPGRLSQTRMDQLPSWFLKTVNITEQVPWCANGRYLTDERAGTSPLHYAGIYYIQEPSAMMPAEWLAAEPGMRVLDLCAAPGGKTTQLAADMQDTGLLVANDVSASRGVAVVKNLERFGVRQFFVTAQRPEELSGVFPSFFDRILVDAPCSGEGMFRRDPQSRRKWLERGPAEYVPLQRQILDEAVKMLRPGGRLVYSTCTFSPDENEDNARWLVSTHPGITLTGQRSLLPHRVRGEGQYAACFEKEDGDEEGSHVIFSRPDVINPAGCESVNSFLKHFNSRNCITDSDWYINDGRAYLLPGLSDGLPRLRFLRTGLYLGDITEKRFVPSQALAMYIRKEEFADTVDFEIEDERVIRYLKGETVDSGGASREGGDGWCLVCAAGLPLGWARREGFTLKNHIDPGRRMR